MPKEKNPKKSPDRGQSKEAASSAVPNERKNFKNLMLGNPNFFGTLPKLGKAVKALSGDTTFEQLTCLGLYPGGGFGGGRLEAVVDIKLHSGYGTDACGAGTTEFVRFFAQVPTGWHDLGLSAVQVYDLPGPLPLSYAVSVDFEEARKYCTTENLLFVRAILSWELEPTAGDPNFIPVYGNVVDVRVQVAKKTLPFIPLGELIAQKVLTVQPDVLKNLDLLQPLPSIEPKKLSYGELKTLYAKEKVPPHRFGFSEALKLTKGSLSKLLTQASAQAEQSKDKTKADLAPGISANILAGVDLGAILGGLASLSTDTSFEQLTCAGYNPETRTLEAVIQVKQSNGFSGGLCSGGSTEYVSFYAFVGGAWQSLGTATVQVYDLAAVIPVRPISYAVFRVSNVTEMPCQDLTGVPLRAILSWQTEPTGPNFIPTWGNVINTNVQPQIFVGDPGVEQVRLMSIGNVSISGIGDTTGLANPTGVTGDCAGHDSPFGGSPLVKGDFIPRVNAFNLVTGDVLPGARPIIYQAWITPSVGSPFQLTNSFVIKVYPPSDVTGGLNKTQTATPALAPVIGGDPAAVYYTYMESDQQAAEPRTLAVFEAGGLAEGNYTIEIRGFKFVAGSYVAIPVKSKMIHVYNGYPHTEFVVGGGTVDQKRPQVAITLRSPFADCGDVKVGDIIQGDFGVTDRFFSSVSIQMIQITVGGVPQPVNPVVLSTGGVSTSYDETNTNGVSGQFTLKTAGLTPCGYTILLQAWDRTLISNSCTGHYNAMAIGFCLRK